MADEKKPRTKARNGAEFKRVKMKSNGAHVSLNADLVDADLNRKDMNGQPIDPGYEVLADHDAVTAAGVVLAPKYQAVREPAVTQTAQVAAAPSQPTSGTK